MSGFVGEEGMSIGGVQTLVVCWQLSHDVREGFGHGCSGVTVGRVGGVE